MFSSDNFLTDFPFPKQLWAGVLGPHGLALSVVAKVWEKVILGGADTMKMGSEMEVGL